MATKTFKVALSLDNPRIIQSGINVRSFDKQSIKISIELTKNSQVYQIPTGAQIKISLLKLARQEQKIVLDVPFTSADSIDWVVPDYLDGYQGEVRVGVYLIVGTENIDVGYFNITSSVSDIDSAAEEFTESVLQGWAIEDLAALLPKFQAVLDETTGKDVISAPEIILARDGATTLGERLEEDKAESLAKANEFERDIRSLELEKVDKGGANQISMQMLDQSLRESLVDGAVAVVGLQSVSLPQFNTTIQKDFGEWRDVSYTSVVGGWNTDGSADDSAYAQQYYKRTSINVSSGELITFELNIANLKRFVFVDGSGSAVKMLEDSSTSIELLTPPESTELRIQYYSSGILIPKIKKLHYAGILSKDRTEKLVADTANTLSDTMYFTLPLVDGKAKYPNLDTATQILTFPKVTEATWKGGRLPLPNGAEVDLSKNNTGTTITGYVRKVYFNKTTNKFEVFGGNDPLNVKDYVFVATIRLSPLNATQKNLSIAMNCRCLVNGEYYSPTEKEELNKVLESTSVGVPNFGLKETDNIKIVYHRGYNKNSPENVAYAFKQAKKRGAIWVECDISYTSDDIPVILHDDTINRTARNDDGSLIDGEVLINNITLEQAKTYDFGIYCGEYYKGERILSLDEFVKLCYQLSLKMRLELKQTVDATRLNAIKTILEKYDMLKNCELVGSYYNLNLAKNFFESTDLIYVVSTVTDTEINNANALKLSTNKVNLAMQIERINDLGNMQKVLDSGFDYEYWTIDTKANLDKALQYIPKAITTNHLDFMEELTK